MLFSYLVCHIRRGGRGSRIIISFIGFCQISIWANAQFLISIFIIHPLKGVAIK